MLRAHFACGLESPSIDPGSPLVRVSLGSKSPRIHYGSSASQGVVSLSKLIMVEPTSRLEPLTCSLRERKRVLPSVGGGCKTRLLKPFSLLRLGQCCRTLRPQWCSPPPSPPDTACTSV